MTMTGNRRSSRVDGVRRPGEQGAVAVEFVLVLPFLVMLVFGITSFGFVMAQSASLAHGAREGARYGVVNMVTAPTCGELINRVKNAAQTIGMGTADVQVSVTGPSGGCGSAAPCTGATAVNNTLRVEASFNTSISIPFVVNRPITLTGDGEYRCEYK